jgi:hypothetical protein
MFQRTLVPQKARPQGSTPSTTLSDLSGFSRVRDGSTVHFSDESVELKDLVRARKAPTDRAGLERINTNGCQVLSEIVSSLGAIILAIRRPDVG